MLLLLLPFPAQGWLQLRLLPDLTWGQVRSESEALHTLQRSVNEGQESLKVNSADLHYVQLSPKDDSYFWLLKHSGECVALSKWSQETQGCVGLKLPEPVQPKLRTHLAPALGAEKAKGQGQQPGCSGGGI